MSAETIRLSRRDLYDLVWAEPVTKVAGRYNLSDAGLRKICLKHRIPLPPRGYWAKLAAGKSVRPIALAAVKVEADIVIRVAPAPSSVAYEIDIFQRAIDAEARCKPIAVPARLSRPHPATSIVIEKLKDTPDSYGAVHCAVPEAPLVRVSPASAARAARLIEALLRAFEARGFTLKDGDPRSHYDTNLNVVVDGFAFQVSLSERMRQIPYEMTPDEKQRQRRGHFVYIPRCGYTATGELTLTLGGMYGTDIRHSWSDRASTRLEERLGEVVLSLRKAAIQRRIKREEDQRREARYQAELQRRAALRAQVEAEQARIVQLEAAAAAWKRAEVIREYANACAAAGLPEAATELRDWIAWARDQADRIDPLTPSPPSILDTPEADMRGISAWEMPED